MFGKKTQSPEQRMQDVLDEQVDTGEFTGFRSSEERLGALEWLMETPSIPLQLRQQFFALWEMVVFGNYSEHDIARLQSYFREYLILIQWYIPEQEWGNTIDYENGNSEIGMSLDLTLLISMLYQTYYIQLTRGKGGFTLKEINTAREVLKKETEKTKGDKKWF